MLRRVVCTRLQGAIAQKSHLHTLRPENLQSHNMYEIHAVIQLSPSLIHVLIQLNKVNTITLSYSRMCICLWQGRSISVPDDESRGSVQNVGGLLYNPAAIRQRIHCILLIL
jgi:hypothetical protein